MNSMPMPAGRALLAEHGDDLGLRGDVEGGGRLVADEQSRRARERAGDHHALQHAARQFVRVLAQVVLGPRQPHGAQQLDRPRLGVGPGSPVDQSKRLGEVVADRAHRVDARARILEDHARVRAAQCEQLADRRAEHLARRRAAPTRPSSRRAAAGRSPNVP